MTLNKSIEQMNVLMVGNNPIELSKVFDHLNKLGDKKIITEIAFDLKSSMERLVNFKPAFIVIDDNIGKSEMDNAVSALLRDRKTRNIPITILKSSNYQEAISSGVMNYILKTNLTGESLYKALKASLQFKRTQLYLQKAYSKRKGQLLRIITPSNLAF
jgi:hypothetical protein